MDAVQVPLMDEWLRKKWCVHTMGYWSAIKKMKPCHLQDGWSQSVLWLETGRQLLHDSTYMRYTSPTSQTQKIEWWLPGPGQEPGELF